MIISHDFGIGLVEYEERGKNNEFPLFDICPNCNSPAHGNLHRNGYYWRYGITEVATLRIPICRLRCLQCEKNISILPDFSGGIRYGTNPVSLKPSLWGGFSQYMYLHPNTVLHKMAKHVPAVEAALTLPLANGFEWMSIEGGVKPGKVVAIYGPGQQGLACGLAAKAAGAEVIIIGRSSSLRRLELARELGMDHIINTTEDDLLSRVHELTGGKMADVVLDVTSGGTSPITSSLEIAKKGGIILLGAYKYQPIPEFNSDLIIKNTLTVKGVRGHSYQSVKMATEFIASGRFPLSLLNSHNYGLDQVDLALKTAGGEGEPSPLLVTVTP
jgi:threonine dehydrogenase-like Zn-dependent dehydrogenase